MATFKTKRRPDSVSASMSLDQHIAGNDPHPQYLLRSALGSELNINIIDLLPMVSDRAALSSYTTVPTADTHAAVDAYVIRQIDNDVTTVTGTMNTIQNVTIPGLTGRIETAEETVAGMVQTVTGLRTDLDTLTVNHNQLSDAHNLLSTNFAGLRGSFDALALAVGTLSKVGNITIIDRLMDHTKVYTQADALGEGNAVTSHVDNTGLNLYAARTHTHSLTSLGIDDVHISVLGSSTSLNTLFAPKVHSHDTEYVTRSELRNTGIYETAVHVGVDQMDYDEDEGTSSVSRDADLDEYTTQGSYYFDRTKVVVLNGPFGVTDGMLNVYTTSSNEDVTYIYQIMYTDDMSWKRTGTITSEEVTSTDELTGDVITSTERVTRFDDWIPLVETTPIGSILTDTRGIGVPRGYLEANGAEVSAAAYPLLWKFVLETGAFVKHSDWIATMQGAYGLSDTFTQYIGTKTITTSDVNNVYVSNSTAAAGVHFVKLTSAVSNQYVGKSCSYIEASVLEVYETTETTTAPTFNLPYLGNKFLKMWIAGNEGSVGKYTEAGLPDITGGISGADVMKLFESAYDAFRCYNYSWAGSHTYGIISTTLASSASDPSTGGNDVQFRASWSNDIYGKSGTVTPENATVRVYIKAYNGSLVKEDRTEAQITEIIRGLIGVYEYATTVEAGTVRLATDDIVNGIASDHLTQPSVVTATQLINKDRSNVKQVVVDGNTYTPSNNTLVLPNFADVLGNRTVVLTMQEVYPRGLSDRIKCTAISDTYDSDRYYDFIVPGHIVDRLDDVTDWINYVDLNVALKRVDTGSTVGEYDLGYPIGSVINAPLCSNKSISDYEHLSKPYVTIFEDDITYAEAQNNSVASSYVSTKFVRSTDTVFAVDKKYYTREGVEMTGIVAGAQVSEGVTYYEVQGCGTSTNKRIVVRLYWPLMWYAKSFAPIEGDTSKLYPMMLPSTNYSNNVDGTANETILNEIETYLRYWTVVIKMSM